MILVLMLALSACTGGETAPETTLPLDSTAPVVDLGVSLRVEQLSDSGATLVFSHSGTRADGELTTGSFFTLQTLTGDGWTDTPLLPQEYDVAWTMEAYLIPTGGEMELSVTWEWLYGKLEPGTYRIGKSVTLFRGPGDFDEAMVWAEFEIGA